MAHGGILHRVTPDHYNLYDEEEELIGSIHHLPSGTALNNTTTNTRWLENRSGESRWFGLHHATRVPTFLAQDRHEAARDLMAAHHTYKTGTAGDVPPL